MKVWNQNARSQIANSKVLIQLADRAEFPGKNVVICQRAGHLGGPFLTSATGNTPRRRGSNWLHRETRP
jgi:hypothetical protein